MLLVQTLWMILLIVNALLLTDTSASPTAVNNRTQLKVSSSDAESCIGQCAFNFVASLKHNLGGADTFALLNLNYNDMLVEFSNSTFFEGFCKIYYMFQFCYTACPHGYMQELLARSAMIVDHFCVYHYNDIRNNFGCLSKLDRVVSKQCLRLCTPHHNAVNSLLHNFRHLAMDGDSTEAEKYLNESCEYVVCTMHCDLPVIAHECGFRTANLIVNITRQSFASMRNMALDTGAVSRWPRVCSEVETYRFPMPKNYTDTIIESTTELTVTNAISNSPSGLSSLELHYSALLLLAVIYATFL